MHISTLFASAPALPNKSLRRTSGARRARWVAQGKRLNADGNPQYLDDKQDAVPQGAGIDLGKVIKLGVHSMGGDDA
ncbi:hypothetical protein [Salipiger mangrovisoli]|uniref:Uncharacterized protein n=1 Tax=Salipiger mangrovisoli TaxID=2865933 RepID=A0ABR9XBM1_9RHOB|nr:hypothetical protein [Salipiger mangrovisoli]MBE9640913.1 hypothetical protein [Salipiger mangrovisoli]